MSDSVKITKVVHGSSISTNEEWNKLLGNQQYGTSTGTSIWLPANNEPDELFSSPVIGRCYSRNCKNETNSLTQLIFGKYINLKTYICESCLEDLAGKVKAELGIEEEEKEDV